MMRRGSRRTSRRPRKTRKSSRRRSRSRRTSRRPKFSRKSRKTSRRQSRSRRANFGMRKYDIPDDFKKFWLGREPNERNPQNNRLFEPRTLGLIGQFLGKNFPFQSDGKISITNVCDVDSPTEIRCIPFGFAVVADDGKKISIYRNNGDLLESIQSDRFGYLISFCFSEDYQTIYALDFKPSRVHVLTREEKNWEYQNSFGVQKMSEDIIVNKRGHILTIAQPKIVTYDTDGKIIASIKKCHDCVGLAIDTATGNIYTADGNMIHEKDSDLKTIKSFADDKVATEIHKISVVPGGEHIIYSTHKRNGFVYIKTINTQTGEIFKIIAKVSMNSFCFNGDSIYFTNNSSVKRIDSA